MSTLKSWGEYLIGLLSYSVLKAARAWIAAQSRV